MAEEKLEKYREKRDFTITREPKGRLSRSKKDKLRFSVQRHVARADHFDLRLEYGGVALSWAVPKGPSYSTGDKRLAMRVEDHPVDYMDFEGTIPKGEYGGGTVMLWDEGEWIPRFSPEKGLKEGSLKFFLSGKRLKGNWALVRMDGKREMSGEPWLLIKERDEFAKSSAGISRFTRGVRSGKSMKEIAGESMKNPFGKAEVMLAEPCAELPKEKGWLFELKYDGHRTLGYCEGGRAALKTRNGYDCTASFPAAARALETLFGERAAIVDGEMVVAGQDGIPDFSALQAHLKDPTTGGLCYVLFDLLSLDGEDLRKKPLKERKERLKKLLEKTEAGGVLSYSAHAERLTARQIRAIKDRGMEGIVAKRADSPYVSGRNGDWQKLKFRGAREFVVGGFSLSETGELRSLLVGYYENGKLVFAGKVGTGFGEREKKELKDGLSRLAQKIAPFASIPPSYSKNAVFVRPECLAQVEYAQITPNGLLRQASFKGLRRDKSPLDVGSEIPATRKKSIGLSSGSKKSTSSSPSEKSTERASTSKKSTSSSSSEKSTGRATKSKKNAGRAEKSKKNAEGAEVCGVLITHPEKVMFPDRGLTKLSLAKYYAEAAPRMLPFLKDRFLSLVCCPSGIEGERFFRKHLEGSFRGVGFAPENEEEGAEIGETEGGTENFFVKNESGILALVQYNAVEFHVRAGKKSAKRPDTMVLDLDPDEGLPLSKTRRGARELKKILEGLGLVSFLKTSGGKGYHLVVPFANGGSAETFRSFARNVALLAEKTFPDLFTAEMSKKARGGKIFLDWQRNSPKATSAAPYSVRAREGAPVSMPIFWEELSKIAPSAITIEKARKRLAMPDPWADFFSVKKNQRLGAVKN